MENIGLVQRRAPRFGLLGGIGAILVYSFASFPFIIFIYISIAFDSNNSGASPAKLSRIFSDKLSDPKILLGILIFNCLGLLIWAYGLSMLRGSKNFFKDFGIGFSKSSIYFFFAGIALQIITIIISVPISLLRSGDTNQQVVQDFKDANGLAKVALFVMVAFVVPFIEELCFRGIFLRGLQKHAKPMVAILVCGIIFGAIHLGDTAALYGLTPLILVGIFASALAVYRGKIDASIALHIGFNITTAIILLFI